jgi:hypothetical protein
VPADARLLRAQVRRQTGVPLLQGGLGALFAGAGPSAAFRVLHGAMYMPLYSVLKDVARDGAGLPAALAVVAAAAGATAATSLLEVPVESLLLRVKAGGVGGGFRGALAAARAAPGGVAALWAGAGPYIARHVLFEAVEFCVYEHLRARALGAAHHGGGHGGHAAHPALSSSTAALLAAAAGAAATVASHPVDVLRVAVAMASQRPAGRAGARAAKALTARAAAARILRTAGPAGFARGLLPRLASTVPGSVIFFVAFEAARARIDAAAAQAPQAPLLLAAA